VGGDVVVVASKIVSKAEGRLVAAADREQAISDEAVRVVASRPRADGGVTRIAETRHGFVMAAAGVDSSNVPDGHVLLLPVDPDESARALAKDLAERAGVLVGVIITDTFGRPWRNAQTDLAIGAAHVRVTDDHRGTADAHGRVLEVAVTALVDEIAAAADLVKGKARGCPVAVVRGLDVVTADAGPGVSALVRSSHQDMFRWGSDEAFARGVAQGRSERDDDAGR
jgi:coenzyme F420-0:L-glutamate ligase/coenzyme F420-1:gamma-L-glutamate ligase